MRSMLTVLVSRSQFDRCEEQLFVCRPRQCRACRPQSRGRVRSKVCNKPPRRLAADEVSSLLRHCSREQRAPLNVCVWGSAEDGFSQPSRVSARLHVAAPANGRPRRAATSGLGCSPPCEAAVSSESGSVSLPGQRLAVSARRRSRLPSAAVRLCCWVCRLPRSGCFAWVACGPCPCPRVCGLSQPSLHSAATTSPLIRGLALPGPCLATKQMQATLRGPCDP